MERRRHHRAPRGSGEQEIFISSIGGDWRVPAELVNLTTGGAQLRVSLEHACPAAVSKPLTVWLCDKGSGISLPIEARLIHRREEGTHRVLGVNFVDQRTLGGLLHPLLGPIFNRRASLRVSPSKREGAIAISLSGPPDRSVSPAQASLVDISTGGLAIDVPVAFEDALGGHDTIGVSFLLPGQSEAFGATMRIVHRTIHAKGGETVRYGAQFLGTEDPAFRVAHEAILGYVIRRQREMAEEHELMSGEGIPLGALTRSTK